MTRSPRCPGLLATVVRGLVTCKLDPSVGRSGPHDFAARFSPRSSCATEKRPSHPAPNVRDDRDTPLLFGRETGEEKSLICPTAQAELSATDWHDGQIAHCGYVRARGRARRFAGFPKVGSRWSRGRATVFNQLDAISAALGSTPTLIVEFWGESGMPDPRPSCTKSARAERSRDWATCPDAG